MRVNRKNRAILVVLALASMFACRRCGGGGTESCEDCVARCVETQKVSPDVCRTTACASVCGQR
jgi:hypothetical protein